MKTVITFDLDGTLIKSGNVVIGGDKTLVALRQLQDMGVHLVANTGRLDHDIVAISQKYDLEIHHRISQNGCVVTEDDVVRASLLDKAESKSVLKFLETLPDVRSELNTVSNRYWKTKRGPLMPKEYYDSHIIKQDFEDVITFQPCVLFLCLGQLEDLELVRNYVDKHCKQLYAVQTSRKSLEILPKGISKGTALSHRFEDAYVIGIGDSENDYSVFEVSDESYYVGQEDITFENCLKVDRIDIALEMILNKLKEVMK